MRLDSSLSGLRKILLQCYKVLPAHPVIQKVSVDGLHDGDDSIQMIFTSLDLAQGDCGQMHDIAKTDAVLQGLLVTRIAGISENKSSFNVKVINNKSFQFCVWIDAWVHYVFGSFFQE
jgi:hypothetical protein